MALDSKRILLVDDDEISRLVAFEVLTHLGVAVDLAATPEDAMRLIGRQRYDLIMLDLFMPTLSGIELADIMIALDRSLAQRIAILTAGSPDGTQSTPATRLRVFHKPLRTDDVLDFLTDTTASYAKKTYLRHPDPKPGISRYRRHQHTGRYSKFLGRNCRSSRLCVHFRSTAANSSRTSG